MFCTGSILYLSSFFDLRKKNGKYWLKKIQDWNFFCIISLLILPSEIFSTFTLHLDNVRSILDVKYCDILFSCYTCFSNFYLRFKILLITYTVLILCVKYDMSFISLLLEKKKHYYKVAIKVTVVIAFTNFFIFLAIWNTAIFAFAYLYHRFIQVFNIILFNPCDAKLFF